MLRNVSVAYATRFPEKGNKTLCHGVDAIGNQYPLCHTKGIMYLCQDSGLIYPFVFFPFFWFLFLPHANAQVIMLCNQRNHSLSLTFLLIFLLYLSLLSLCSLPLCFVFLASHLLLFCQVMFLIFLLPVGPPELTSLGELSGINRLTWF